MRRNSYLVLAVVTALCLGGVLLTAGCSDSSSREAGRNMSREVDKAQKLYDRAVALLANVYYKVDGQDAPLTVVHKGSPRIDCVDAPVNPQAEAALEAAEKCLKTALQQNSQAPQDQQVIARQMWGRVLTLKAHCSARRANVLRTKAFDEIRGAMSSISAIRRDVSLLAYLDRLGAMGNEDVEAILSELTGQIAAFRKQITAKTASIKDKQTRRNELLEKNRIADEKARQLKQQSDAATGDKSLELFDEAQSYEKQSAQLLFNAEKVEYEIELLKRGVVELEKEIVATRLRKHILDGVRKSNDPDSTDGVLVQRANDAKARAATKKQTDETLSADRKTAETHLAAIAATCEELAKAEKQIVDYDIAAADQFKNAARISGASSKQAGSSLAADEAEAWLAAADIETQSLSLQVMNSQVVGQAIAVCQLESRQVPQSVRKIEQYVSKPDELRKIAAGRCEKAVGLYKKAQRSVENIHRWIYQSHLANAQYRLGMLRKDAGGTIGDAEEALNAAKKSIAQALDQKRESPYLKESLQLEAMIERQIKN